LIFFCSGPAKFLRPLNQRFDLKVFPPWTTTTIILGDRKGTSLMVDLYMTAGKGGIET
jgi:hypothetical protein